MKPLQYKINFFLWSRIHRLPRVFIEWWQLYQLQRCVREAFFVPIYNRLYTEAGIEPGDLKTLADIRKLPLAKKELFQQAPIEDILHRRFQQNNYRWDCTSGSTGEPFRFPVSRFKYFSELFGPCPGTSWDIPADRFLLWQGFSPSYIYKNIRLVKFRQSPKPRGRWCLNVPISSLRDNPHELIKHICNFKPDLLEGRATVLAEFARLCDSLPKHMRPAPRFATVAGEILIPSCRKYIEKVFDTEVYDLYGLQETSDIGCECSEHNGLHIYEESCLVEILDENGLSMPPATNGRVVVTHFFNDVLPFIRYDTGDRGTIQRDPCPCGLSNPRLYVDGREGGFVVLGGKKYHFYEFAYVIKTQFNDMVLRFQFVKISEDELELRFIPAKNYCVLEERRIQEAFYEVLGLRPKIKIVSAIPYTKEGKTLPVITS